MSKQHPPEKPTIFHRWRDQSMYRREGKNKVGSH